LKARLLILVYLVGRIAVAAQTHGVYARPDILADLLIEDLGDAAPSRPELAHDATDEEALRTACSPPGYCWECLRFVQEGGAWRPAAGSFPGWPGRAADITVLDPCCGSGHFLTEALAALTALRGAEEELPAADAVTAVLRDNLVL
jgi:hypothetical protein